MQSLCLFRKLRKREIFLRESEICRYYTFVASGCLRAYRIGTIGTEHILKFAIENCWISDRESLVTGEPSTSFIDAVEDSELIMWTGENFCKILNRIPVFDKFFRSLLELCLDASQNRIYTSISNNAGESYNHFVSSYPAICNRVPLHMIASYLGVSRETLSRVRSQHGNK